MTVQLSYDEKLEIARLAADILRAEHQPPAALRTPTGIFFKNPCVAKCAGI